MSVNNLVDVRKAITGGHDNISHSERMEREYDNKSCIICGDDFRPTPIHNKRGEIVENKNRDTCVKCLYNLI